MALRSFRFPIHRYCFAVDAVAPYEIPLWHPLVVHLPPALSIAVVVLAALWLLRGRRAWLDALVVITTLAALGTIASFYTGEAAYAQSEGVPIVEELVELHEDAGLVAMWASIALAIVTAALSYRHREGEAGLGIRIAFFLLSLGVVGVIAWTAHVGGLMVWGVPAG